MTVSSLTLRRSEPDAHQFTVWSDGVARWDGDAGSSRPGAWRSEVPPGWFQSVAAAIPGIITLGESTHVATVVVEHDDNTSLTFSGDPATCPSDFWVLSTLLEGMAGLVTWERLSDRASGPDGLLLHLSHGGIVATARWRPDGRTTVLRGSHVSAATWPSLTDGHARLRHHLIEKGTLRRTDDSYVLMGDCEFASPSGAASFVTGQSVNGRRVWRRSDGTALADITAV